MKESHSTLKKAITIMEAFAWIAGILFIIGALIILIGGGSPGSPRSMGLLSLAIGILYFSVLYSMAGAVKLLMEIADNTRQESLK